MEGFVYPNQTEVQWGLLIVLYPYITGLVAGAFIVSALHQVFGITSLEKVSRLSLLAALAFLLVAPLALLAHLGRPERALEIFWTPNFRSAMAGFGYVWMSYLILLTAEVWLVFRSDIVAYANSSRGFRRTLYTTLALGVLELPDKAVKLDKKLAKILAVAGIPAAAVLHGYVGFIFGAIKANPWWSSSLMPVIFLLSAMVSGIALLTVIYVVLAKVWKEPLEHRCVETLTGWLLGFLIVAVALETLEVLGMLYESEESLEIIVRLITQRLAVTYLVIQVGFGALLPGVALAVVRVVNTRSEVKTLVGFLSACAVLVGVLAMRWNVVIGGQLFSKSLRGLISYTPALFGGEGILAAMLFLALPVGIFVLLVRVLPPWHRQVEPKAALWEPGYTGAAIYRTETRWGQRWSRTIK